MSIITSNLREEFAHARRVGSQGGTSPRKMSMPQPLHLGRGGHTITSAMHTGSAAGGDIANAMPPIHDPRLNPDNFYLPHVDARSGMPNSVLQQWIQHYYLFNPLVGNAVEIHSQLPISRFDLVGVDDPEIEHVYEQMSDDLDLVNNMYNFLKCWWLFGEVMPYWWWDDDYNRFVQMTFIDTGRVRVIGHYLTFSEDGDTTITYELEPDQLLRDIIQSIDPYESRVAEFINSEIAIAVRQGLNIELDPFSTQLVCNKAFPWDMRGTSIMTGILKDLIYQDTLRLAQNTIARGHILPKWIWKLGSAGPDGYFPTDDDLAAFRDMLMNAANDPSFQIITHYAVSAEVIGSSGKILDISREWDASDNRIMARLFTNKSLTHGEGPTYSNATVALRALMSRYIPVRAMLEDVFRSKVFLPVALANNFKRRRQADLDHRVRTHNTENEPIVPNFSWRHKQSLLDDATIRSSLLQLRQNGDLPLKIICDAYDIDYDEAMKWLEQEQGTLADRQMVRARETVITKIAQSANPVSEGLTAIYKYFKNLILPGNKNDLDTRIRDAENATPTVDATPQQAFPGTSGGTATPGATVSPPKVVHQPGETIPDTGYTAPATGGTTGGTQSDSTRAPLGGWDGENTTKGDIGGADARKHGSLARLRQNKMATKPYGYHPITAMKKRIKSKWNDEPLDSLNNWQERLLLTRIDKDSKNDIIDSERGVIQVFNESQVDFVQQLVSAYTQKSFITIEDVEAAIRDVTTKIIDISTPVLNDTLSTLWNRAQDAAVSHLARSKRGRHYIARRQAQSEDRRQLQQDALQNAFQRINTVSSDVVESMRDLLHSGAGDDVSRNVISTLFDEYDATQLENLSIVEIEQKLGEIWDKQRYIYQRIIRTETVNMYSRASLQEWFNSGVKQVIRREINDHRTCGYCRTVDGNVYDIEKLLSLAYPLIQNPDTGEYEGHPQCRGSFEPIVTFTDWDDFIPPPGAAFDNVHDMDVGGTSVRNVPHELVDAIEQALQNNDISKDVSIVPDIIDTNAWLDAERQRILQELGDQGDSISGIRLDLLVQESQESQRGQISTFELPTGELMVSGFSFFADEPNWFVFREKGRQLLDQMSRGARSELDALYASKINELSYKLEDDGLEIVGSPAGGNAGFITPAAGQDVDNYFIESYALYQTDSSKLEFLDSAMYSFISDIK